MRRNSPGRVWSSHWPAEARRACVVGDRGAGEVRAGGAGGAVAGAGAGGGGVDQRPRLGEARTALPRHLAVGSLLVITEVGDVLKITVGVLVTAGSRPRPGGCPAAGPRPRPRPRPRLPCRVDLPVDVAVRTD